MKLLNYLNKTIEYSFYLLLFLVPLALTGDTSELFEFNKLWVTFILAIVIAVAWICKMVVQRKFAVQRTPLDIPIGLFVISQIVSTIFSLDVHTSLWGYYSRFNGGLYSIFTYVFLYYAFVSNYKDFGQGNEEKALSGKRILIFVLGGFIFFGGNYLSSLFVKAQSGSLMPIQMLVSLFGTLVSFAVLMYAAPVDRLKKAFYAILSSTVLVVLWGFPSHFGFDPTCLLFRGTLNVSCWTADFQPKIRLFSTMGQPDWLAAYLVALIPLTIGIFLNFVSGKDLWQKGKLLLKNYALVFSASLFAFILIAYLTLLYTISRSAIAAMWICFVLFGAYYLWFYVRPKFDRKNLKHLNLDFKLAAVLVVLLYAITFFNGQPFSFLNIFTLNGIKAKVASVSKTAPPAKPAAKTPSVQPVAHVGELGGTDSGIIRKYVWEGAINVWKNYPLFGSGVETYAFAYYKYRPVGHNLTSEWNYLYNKAHNEYLNYLATTGTFGILTYLSMIGTFLFFALRFLMKNSKKPSKNTLLVASLVTGYIGILISNFFGFSVVFINILFYLIPAFVLIIINAINEEKTYAMDFAKGANSKVVTKPQYVLLIFFALIGFYLIFVLVRFWQADRNYYYGFGLDQSGDYQRAYPYLNEAVKLRPSEPTFRNELSINNATLATAIIYQNQQKQDQQSLTLAKQLVDQTITQSNRLKEQNPNDIVFVKTRVRVFYTLSQVNPSYLPLALEAIKTAKVLAPTDADISYNLGVLLGQTGDLKGGIKELEKTTQLKPDYQGGNAYYALGIFYHQLSLDKNGKVVNRDYLDKAIGEMKYILKAFGPNAQAQTALDTWQKE